MTTERREIPPTGILQEWVAKLGLRHQGVLLAAVRGCDTEPKESAAKELTRSLRGEILNTHCADPEKAKSFIEFTDVKSLTHRMQAVIRDHDNLPHHYVMHLVHAAEILGNHGPFDRQVYWWYFYREMCRKMHVNPETKQELDERLNASEEDFFAGQ